MILFFIALFLFLQTVLNLGKYPSNLACGLGGYNGKVPPQEMILRVIGKYNESRGTHSCGISNDFKTLYGVDKKKVFTDFAEELEELGTYKKTNNFILHTRHATVGVHSESNAHPFGFGAVNKDKNNNQSYKFVGAHNGTIVDWRELTTSIPKNLKKKLDMDSKALLYRIYHDKNFKVLSEYKGAAALLFYSIEEPDVLYAYKGAAGGTEERPLFYLQIKNDKGEVTGSYLSSLITPFRFCGFKYADIITVPDNTLLKFKGGEVIEQITVKRDTELHEDFIKAAKQISRHNPRQLDLGYTNDDEEDVTGGITNLRNMVTGFQRPRQSTFPRKTSLITNASNSSSKSVFLVNDIFEEKESLLAHSLSKKDFVVFKYTRYFLNHRLLQGIYLIDKCGRVYHTQPHNTYKEFLADYKTLNFKEKSEYEIHAFHKGLRLNKPVEYDKIYTYQAPEAYRDYISHPFVMISGNKFSNIRANSYVFVPKGVTLDGVGTEDNPYWFKAPFSLFRYKLLSSRLLFKVENLRVADSYIKFVCATAAEVICNSYKREIEYVESDFNDAKALLKALENVKINYSDESFNQLLQEAYSLITDGEKSSEIGQNVIDEINRAWEKEAERQSAPTPSPTNSRVSERNVLVDVVKNTAYKKGLENYIDGLVWMFDEFLNVHAFTNINPNLKPLAVRLFRSIEFCLEDKASIARQCREFSVDVKKVARITKFVFHYKDLMKEEETKIAKINS